MPGSIVIAIDGIFGRHDNLVIMNQDRAKGVVALFARANRTGVALFDELFMVSHKRSFLKLWFLLTNCKAFFTNCNISFMKKYLHS